jgi:hypothetical protein
LFLSGELVGSRFNQSLGVDGSFRTFTRCECQIGCGDMFVECIDRHSFLNYSLVTTSKEISMDSSTLGFFFFSFEIVVVLENQWVYPLLTKETSDVNKPL